MILLFSELLWLTYLRPVEKNASIMIRPFRINDAIVLLLLLLTACGGSGVGEPNDSKSNAGMLKSGKAIKMKIDSAGDQDWYAIAPSEKGYVEVNAKNVPQELSPRVRFEGREGDVHKLPAADRLEGDTLYFSVHNADETIRSKKSFSLTARYLEEMDPHEPNDSLPQVGSLETGKKLSSYVIPMGDRDLFKVEVDSTGYLYARALETLDSVNSEVRFLKKGDDGGLLPISGYRLMPAGASVNETGSYYVEVGDDHNDAWSKESVDWKLEFVAQMDSTEPNARRRDAHPIASNDTVRIALFPQSDRDLFRFTPERSRTLRISVKGAKGMTPQVQLVQGAISNRNVTEWQTLPGHFEVEKDKEYFLTLRLKGDGEGSREPFLLRLGEAPSS